MGMANKLIQLTDGVDNLYPAQPTKTGTITATSGMTVWEERIKQTGKVVEVHFYVSTTSAFGASQVSLGTISGVALPPKNIRFHTGTGTQGYNLTNGAYGILGTSGLIAILAGKTTDTVVGIDVVYTVD